MKKLTPYGLVLLGLVSTAPLKADQWTGRWSAQFGWPIIPIHATLLPNGKVFSFGTDGNGTQQAYNYDVWTPGWAGGGDHKTIWHNQGTDLFCSATNLMPNGNVLISGGDTRNPYNVGIKDTLVLTNGGDGMYRAPYMQFARWYPTLITLPNGESFVHGGREWDGQPIAAPEIFNGGSWRTLWGASSDDVTGNQEGKWFYPRDWVAPNGRIFGMSGDQMYFIDWGGNGGVQLAGKLPNKTRSHTSTAVMYRPGQIFQSGGSVWGDTQAEGSRQAITVDIRSGWPQVQNLPDMNKRRVWGNSTVLANGEVLITGGSAYENKDNDSARLAEMWNPDSRQFRNLKSAATPRLYHSISLLLPDGSVLVGGGGAPGPYTNRNAEIFWPPYLFNGNDFAPRPTLGDFATNQNYNNVVNVPVGGAGQPARVTLVRSGSVTHSFDMSQRFMDLQWSQQGGSVRVTMPNSPNIAPPGFYLLFVINNAGVPSVAKIISLKGDNPGGGGGGGGGTVTPPPPVTGGVAPRVGGTYEIIAKNSGKCVDLDQGSAANGAKIHQWSCSGSQNQKWRVESAPNGAFRLVSAASGKCIDLSGPSAADGAKLHQWACHGGGSQSLKFAPVSGGAYQLKLEYSGGKCVDIEGPSVADGALIHQWQCFGGAANQEFYFRGG